MFWGEVTRDMRAPSSESEEPDNQLKLRTKVWFGVGTIGESATNWIFNALTFIYYGSFNRFNIRPIQVSIRTSAPVYVCRPIPLAASIFLIFNPREAILGSQDYLFYWLLVFTICMRTFVTFFAVPHLAMGAELSTDYIERTNVMSFNNLFGYYGLQLMHIVTWFIFFGWLFKEEGEALGVAKLFGQAYYRWLVFVVCW